METGTIINEYTIISAIGKGGMGEVLFHGEARMDPLKRTGLPE